MLETPCLCIFLKSATSLEKRLERYSLKHMRNISKRWKVGEWLNKISQSCSLVASLIATVAFASATAFPGGNNGDGLPNFQGNVAFSTFVTAAFMALCFSLTSLIIFLTILISPYQESDLSRSLPRKLILGLTSLFFSMGSMLVSFCAAHYYFLKGKIKYVALPLYALGCLPIILIVIQQFPFYSRLLFSVHGRKPRPWYREFAF